MPQWQVGPGRPIEFRFQNLQVSQEKNPANGQAKGTKAYAWQGAPAGWNFSCLEPRYLALWDLHAARNDVFLLFICMCMYTVTHTH